MLESRAEFTHRAARVIGLMMLAALAVLIVVMAADVLLVFFGGVLLAVFFRGLADLLSEHSPLSPRVSLTLVLLVFFVVLLGGGYFLAAEVAGQLDQLGADLRDLWAQVKQRLQQETWGRQLLSLLGGQDSGAVPEGSAESTITQAFSTTLGGVANFFIILFMGMYIAINPAWYRRGLLRMLSPAQRDRAREILNDIGHALRWWLLGRAVSMIVVGVVTGTGLALLGVPLALALGVLAGALDFVPFVGPIAAAAPGILISLSGGITQAAYVAALYVGIQFFEGYILTPMVEQRSVKLPPALTISAQVLLGVLVGALGVVFATPLLAVIVIIIKRLYVEDTLEQAPHIEQPDSGEPIVFGSSKGE